METLNAIATWKFYEFFFFYGGIDENREEIDSQEIYLPGCPMWMRTPRYSATFSCRSNTRVLIGRLDGALGTHTW